MYTKLFCKTLALMLSVLMLCALSPAAAAAEGTDRVIHVSPAGSDTDGSGTEEAPFATIEKALTMVEPGVTVCVHEGTYGPFALTGEHSGTAEAPVTVAAAEGEAVVIDATDAPAGISMTDVDNITLEGFEVFGSVLGIDYESTTDRGELPLENVTIRGNRVHDIVGEHGICVYAHNYQAPMTNLVMEDNEVFNCRCYWSESTVFNGNIDGFTIRNNVIHDNNNLGIDMIGFEGTAALPEGEEDPYQVDFVRNGQCYGNVVYNISSFNNEAYWTSREDDEEWYDEYASYSGDDPSLAEEGFYDRCADGIYVDGGQDIQIYENFVFNCDIGIEIATEHAEADDPRFEVSGMDVHDNVIAGCTGWAGICFGGYDSDLGFTHDCSFHHNTLVDNGVAFAAQRSWGNTLENNLISGDAGFEVNALNDDEDYLNDNTFGANCWIGTDNEWMQDMADQSQAKAQLTEGEAPDPAQAYASAVEGMGSSFTPAQEYVDLYQALLDAQENELPAALAALEAIRDTGIEAADLADSENNVLVWLTAALADQGIENVKLEMMPAPVGDPDGLILCGKGGEELASVLALDGTVNEQAVQALEEDATACISVCVRLQYEENTWCNARVSSIPVHFTKP